VKLYKLGKVPWHESQLIYHALAALGREALSLVSPVTPYVCIGFHQDVDQELDLEFCKANGIPVFRREVGGGATYLDGDQLFFQLILRRDNPEVPMTKEAFYRKFLQPIINVYRGIGIPAEYRPINDVITGTRKISGTGVGEIGDCIVFVGNLITDFNYEMMSRVLKVPDEKFRDKVHKTLMENLSTIRRELGVQRASEWDEATLNALMAQEFQKLIGPMHPSQKDKALQAKIDELGEWMMSDAWLYQKGKTVSGRDVKIREGIKVVQKLHKASGGLIRADFELKEGKFKNVSISGDFFCFPEEAISLLESRLEGRSTQEIPTILERFYSEEGIETPGIGTDDWMRVLTK
jgi:lipoate-protein ligase A